MGQAFITRRGGGGYSKKATGFASGTSGITTITVSGLGFAPKVVYISDVNPYFDLSHYMQMAYKDEETSIVYASDGTDQSSNPKYALTLTNDGFTWDIGYTNANNLFWFALG